MYSNGTIVAHTSNGDIRKASTEEINTYLASLLPKTYKGEKLSSFQFNKEDGCLYAKYATKRIKKQIIATQMSNKTEPIDGVQNSKDVPSKPEKAKPETKKVTKDRPDVANPKKVRKRDYGLGKDNMHTDVVPRSKGNSGLEGGKKTTFESEKAEKATSGKPDSYVQKYTPTDKPAKAGSEKNHTASNESENKLAGSEIKWKSDSEVYQNLHLANKEKDEAETKAKKSEGKSSKKLPWEKDNSDSEECCKETATAKATNTEKTAGNEFEKLYKEAKRQLLTKEAEVNKYIIREARREKAINYALALLKLNPKKYASAEIFNDVIEKTLNSEMNIDAIERATEEVNEVQKEAENTVKKTVEAFVSSEADGGLATAIVIPADDFRKSASIGQKEELTDIFMSGTKIGKMLNDFDESDHQ
jgi:hypothetical protein